MIPQDTVNKILDTAQIVEVVSDFVSLKRRGANYVACCPFHNEKTPSFSVSPTKGIYHCFGCGKTGSAVRFVMEHESMSYVEALKYLAKKYGIEVREKEETAEEIASRQRRESLMLVLDYTERFFQESLRTQEGRNLGYAYFKSRGLEDSTIEKYGLGWSPMKGTALCEKAVEDGYKPEYLVATGVCIQKDDGTLVDKFRERAMFPIHTVSGRIIGFGGRTLRSDYKERNIGKYVNSPQTEVYDKKTTLYGIYFAKSEIARRDRCILVEGYLDVLSMHQLGITNVVASSGTSLTVEQVSLIRKFTENVTIMYDGDAAGIHAAERGIGLCLKGGLNVRVVLIPDGDDPDSFARKHTLEEVKSFIEENERDFISYRTDQLIGDAGSDPVRRSNLVNEIAGTLALIPDQVKRAMYVQDVSTKFNIDESLVYSKINDAVRAMREEERKEEMRRQRALEAGSQASAEGGIEDGAQPAGGDGNNAGGDAGQDRDFNLSGNAGGAAPKPEPLYEDPLLLPSEKELAGLILNHGMSELEFETDSEYYDPEGFVTVADFIRDALEVDGHQFSNSIMRKIYDEYFDLYDSSPDMTQEDIVRTILNGEDTRLADEAASMLSMRHELTVKDLLNSMTATSSFLVRTVPKAILVYKLLRVKKQELELAAALQKLRRQGGDNIKEQFGILQQVQKVNMMRKNISERLGRVQ
ncbi:MAG: DNA primase [Candidatus Cryptobacteroides sp.]|nr:DNA primase [Bacteroidales bacterium]MDY4572527.1 DNA primase [Candidatus Cryptobacteroides sp.]